MGSALIIGACSSLFLTFGLSMNAETVILFVSRCFTLCAFTVLYIFTPEAYPTSSRSLGMGVNNAFSRAGGMIAPFIAVNLPEAVKLLARFFACLHGHVSLGKPKHWVTPVAGERDCRRASFSRTVASGGHQLAVPAI